jgi:hypothetical protein
VDVKNKRALITRKWRRIGFYYFEQNSNAFNQTLYKRCFLSNWQELQVWSIYS